MRKSAIHFMIYRIIENNGGSPPLTFSLFNLVTSTIGPPPRPVEDPDFTDISLPVSQNHDKQFGIPTLEDLSEPFFQCLRNHSNN